MGEQADDVYWTERREREARSAQKRERREDLARRLGFVLMWASVVVLAFGIGTSYPRLIQGSTPEFTWAWIIMGLFFAGLALFSTNRRKR